MEKTNLKKDLAKAHLRIKELENLTSSIFEGIGDAAVVIDRDFKLVSANSGYLKQTKYNLEQVIGKHCYEVSHRSTRPCYENGEKCSVWQTFKTGERRSAIHTHTDRQGNSIYVKTCSYPLKDEGGRIVSAIETITDVTEEIILEKKLKESEEKYRELYNSAPEMLHSVNREGIIIECNVTEAKTLGYRKEELLGRPFTEILSPESKKVFAEKFGVLKKTGYLEAECEFVSKDGSLIPVLVKSKAHYDSNGAFLKSNTISTDLTEIKKALEEKAVLENMLIQSQKMEAIGTLAGGIAHDFNNILTGILSYAQLAEMKTTDSYIKKSLRQIFALCQKASDLIKQILLMGRKLSPDFKVIDLNLFLKESITPFLHIIENNIELKLSMTENQPYIKADPSQLGQAIMNLTLNARDALLEKGGTIRIMTDIFEADYLYCQRFPYSRPGRYAVISVSDSGDGIPEGIRDKIFEPFFTTKAVGKGTGLGLSVTYSVIKNHSGWLTFSSEPDKGTEFLMYLPMIETRPQVSE